MKKITILTFMLLACTASAQSNKPNRWRRRIAIYFRSDFCMDAKHPEICDAFGKDAEGVEDYIWKLRNKDEVPASYCAKEQHKVVCDAFDADYEGHEILLDWLRELMP